MAKRAKKEEPEFVDGLRSLGLGEQSATTIADTITTLRGDLADSTESALVDLIAKVDELQGRAAAKQGPDDGDREPAKPGAKKKKQKKQKK